jgi:malonyl-CoA/methylmalonyl-CoA synthetase
MSKPNHLFDAIFEPTKQSPELFLINNNGEITYSEFHKTINQIANLLIQKGMKPGERVAVQAEKSNLQIAYICSDTKSWRCLFATEHRLYT